VFVEESRVLAEAADHDGDDDNDNDDNTHSDRPLHLRPDIEPSQRSLLQRVV